MNKTIKYLALGDSYTKGEAVDSAKSFPNQLVHQLENTYNIETTVKVVAQTGWRTDELIQALKNEKTKGGLSDKFDLVTLLIGVNNQYQQKSFYQFKNEFILLIQLAKNLVVNKDNIRVLSIPDYAFTPFGKGNPKISEELQVYNAYIKKMALQEGLVFIDITDITKRGLVEKEIVATDDLHISAKAYKEFVNRILASLSLE